MERKRKSVSSTSGRCDFLGNLGVTTGLKFEKWLFSIKAGVK